MLPIRQPTNSWVQGRVRTPRKTNVLRPVYRLGWLVIWSTWLVTVVLVMMIPMMVIVYPNLWNRQFIVFQVLPKVALVLMQVTGLLPEMVM